MLLMLFTTILLHFTLLFTLYTFRCSYVERIGCFCEFMLLASLELAWLRDTVISWIWATPYANLRLCNYNPLWVSMSLQCHLARLMSITIFKIRQFETLQAQYINLAQQPGNYNTLCIYMDSLLQIGKLYPLMQGKFVYLNWMTVSLPSVLSKQVKSNSFKIQMENKTTLLTNIKAR